MQRMLLLYIDGFYITQSPDIEVLREYAKTFGCAAKICDAGGHLIEKIKGGTDECKINKLLRENRYYKQRKIQSSAKQQ